MAETWTDQSKHWKSTGHLQPDGSLTGATVEDTNRVTRGLNLTFHTKQDFISWVSDAFASCLRGQGAASRSAARRAAAAAPAGAGQLLRQA